MKDSKPESNAPATTPGEVAPAVLTPGYANPEFGPSREPWARQIPRIATSGNQDKYPTGYMVEPPTADPLAIYDERSASYPFQQEALSGSQTQLPADGQTPEEHEKSLRLMQCYYVKQRDHFLGYQCAEQFEVSEDIAPFLNMSLNNIGDPFQNGYFSVNAKQAERAVLDFFASLWHAQWPSLPKPPRAEGISDEAYLRSPAYQAYKESYWGYVLSMGSTEGNLYAVLSARDYLSGYSLVVDDARQESLCLPNPEEDPVKYTPVAFYSEAAHYSLAKAVHAMGVKTFSQLANEMRIKELIQDPGKSEWECPLEGSGGEWPESVPVDAHGSVVIPALVTLVEFFAKKGYPIFICFNYGTTFKGAYDDIPEACKELAGVFKTYRLNRREVSYLQKPPNCWKTDYRRGYWIHVDAALAGTLMPFVEMGVEHGKIGAHNLAPCFDFRNKEVMSIVTSGHKWARASAPTGIYMTRNKYLITPVATPDYLGSADTTFAGSRNGLSAMILWDLIAKHGVRGFFKLAQRTMELCDFAEAEFKQLAQELKDLDIWLQRAPHGGTSIIFRKPIDEIMFKYSLPIEVQVTKATGGSWRQTFVHLFVFWDRTEGMIRSLIHDLRSRGEAAFDPAAEQFVPDVEAAPALDAAGAVAAPSRVKLLTRSVHKGFR